MREVFDKLISQGIVITDGAWGTELQRQGLPSGEFPDAWNLQHPERVLEVARAYAAAGSQVILTNTFGSNRLRLIEAGLEAQVREINCAGVWISREGAHGRAAVFASVGPSGKMLVTGEVTELELQRCFAGQLEGLAEAGPDAIVVETMSDLDEARIAVAAAAATGLPVVACMTFDTGKQKDRTMMGQTPEQVAESLAAAGASVIGTNCGHGISTSLEICQRLRAATALPVWTKPNAGLPEALDGMVHYRMGPDEFASFAPELVRAGANFIGGCCGSNPDFIRAIKKALEKASSTNACA